MNTKLTKMKDHAFRKDVYFLGKDADGNNCWLEAASFDCGWYWGFGYIETYEYNHKPSKARDINSHSHWCTFFSGVTPDDFRKKIVDTPLNDKEIWQLMELMHCYYAARKYSDMLHCGGAHISSQTEEMKSIIVSEEEYQRINTVIIPKIAEQVYKILSPEN